MESAPSGMDAILPRCILTGDTGQPMEEPDEVAEAAERVAGSIARRDVATLRALLAPDFVHRTHGGAAVDAEAIQAAVDLPTPSPD
jgi:hypothetical protein